MKHPNIRIPFFGAEAEAQPEKPKKEAKAEKPRAEKAPPKTDKPKTRKKTPKTDKPKEPKKPKLSDREQEAVDAYNRAHALLDEKGTLLHHERIRAGETIDHVTSLVNSIAAHPKSFDVDLEASTTGAHEFIARGKTGIQLLRDGINAALRIGTASAAGTAVTALGPSGAMWVATTFGTASTGTAISTLSGAAAESAALAWLGGGALTAGGSGVAGGSALLALAGPLGWGIAGFGILGSIAVFTFNRWRSGKKTKDNIAIIKENCARLETSIEEIDLLLDKTIRTHALLKTRYRECLTSCEKDFTSLPEDAQARLGALVNETRSLGVLLAETVSATPSSEEGTEPDESAED